MTFEFEAPKYIDFMNVNTLDDDGADKFFEDGNKDASTLAPRKRPANKAVDGGTPTKQICMGLDAMVLQESSSSGKKAPQRRGSRARQISESVGSAKKNTRRRSRSLQLENSNSEKESRNFVSMAEAVLRFQNSTPDRFHTKPGVCKPKATTKLHPTFAKSPKLISHLRARPVACQSQEVKEEQELMEMQRHHFRAAPVKDSVLKGPPIKKMETRLPTKPSPFRLTEVKKTTTDSTPGKREFVFKAAPFPSNIFSGEKQTLRQADGVKWGSVVVKKDGAACITETRLEHPGMRMTPSKDATDPKPFSSDFEERNKLLIQRREEKVKKYIEAERKAREFRANPVPKALRFQPETKTSLPTQPQPFNLLTEERIASYEEQKKKKLEESQDAHQVPIFKAKPPLVLQKPPFEPVRPHRVLTEITDICLNTEQRSKEREKFDKALKEKEEMMENYRKQILQKQQQAEEEERARLRKEAIHKAQPVPNYPPVQVIKSTKELTVPHSPFHRKK